MATLINVDFVSKKELSRVEISNEEDVIPDMPDQAVLDKLSYFAELVGSGSTTVKFNGAHPRAELPEGLGSPNRNLNFSHAFTPNDLKYDALGVTQSLSFNGQMFTVKVPWEAVDVISLTHGGQSRVWVDGVPPKDISFANKPAQPEEPKPEPEPPPRVA